jgi:hypothetical protein
VSGARKDYVEWPRKNHWRRGVWNDIAELVTGPRWSASILYLAGEQNRDAVVARLKGFDPRKMVAVEKDAGVLEVLRAHGVNTIQGDITDVMTFWPPAKPIDVVVGDFCCGLERALVHKLLALSLAPQTHGTVFMFNFMRGRDSSSNVSRGQVTEFHEELGAAPTKHRGDMFLTWFFLWSFGFWRRHTASDEVRARIDDAEFMTGCANRFKDWLLRQCDPRKRSYASDTGQVFDSITFRSHMRRGQFDDAALRLAHEHVKVLPGSTAMRRRIAASMALQTARLK